MPLLKEKFVFFCLFFFNILSSPQEIEVKHLKVNDCILFQSGNCTKYNKKMSTKFNRIISLKLHLNTKVFVCEIQVWIVTKTSWLFKIKP